MRAADGRLVHVRNVARALVGRSVTDSQIAFVAAKVGVLARGVYVLDTLQEIEKERLYQYMRNEELRAVWERAVRR